VFYCYTLSSNYAHSPGYILPKLRLSCAALCLLWLLHGLQDFTVVYAYLVTALQLVIMLLYFVLGYKLSIGEI